MPATRTRTSTTTYRNGTRVVTTVYRPLTGRERLAADIATANAVRAHDAATPMQTPGFSSVALRKYPGWSVRAYNDGTYRAVAPSGWVSQSYNTFPGAVCAARTSTRRHGR